MTFLSLRKTGLLILCIIIAGCSGDYSTDYSDSYVATTYKSQEQVVAGLVYGYTAKTLSTVSGALVSPQLFTSPESGQYAITNYPAVPAPKENIFSASFTDQSRLYSVWSGAPTATANVTVSSDQTTIVNNPSNVTVSPDTFEARANINPITDLAYWYWLYEKRQSPYFYYQTSVFLFFKNRYSLPEQDAVHDYPSQELLQMFKEVQIKLSADAAGFSLISNSTGKTICTATFAQFPICN